ncbi:ATP-dependent DNA helicase Q1 isoform X2 [Dicentrarchus labrax]|nr:ATP-dependent DNA helicase Q1 isoform X2 [Dicentrarchus labrax]XP_051247653.1 ATP-dependent DNA helicase Q1 isoform X2 [Dicentrarchus labrax]XP_051247655.1 ATP-dependent DNA helicase Q1 isoform X2 [Dicentrarchus labrax]XP_051247656.1 ATP-dependent DNA helicase Q1 isoform X2 [Dicentrarchus labrax]
MDYGGRSSDVQGELDSVEAELELVELQIADLLQKQTELTTRKNALLQELEEACDAAQPSSSSSSSSSKSSRADAVMSKQEMQRFDSTDFPWSKEVEQHLKDSFHLSKFRPLQLRAVNLTLSGKDLFLVMPTGRGKSLCYQLPAVCSKGFTLVVTPLVSLMEDQIMYLKSIDVSAVMLNASSSKEHAKTVMAGMTDPKSPFKLVYVTPEKIAKSKLLMSRLEKAYNANLLSHIAVDEVHCCSQWGHDFRPDYKLLGILKRQFPKVPLLGLTATATSSVLKDCEKILCVPQPITLTASFNRTNLYYEVRIKDSDIDASISDIASLIKNRYKDQSGIVYVFSQKDAESVSSELQKRDILAYPYHGNMDPNDKSRVHRKWTSNKIQVVVATVAFGMGIDKPDVRFVIHHTISKSIENYYQESGRAGRDDSPADCIVYFGFSDIFRISTMVVMENVGQQKLRQMVDYCQNVDRCRRSLMAVHFDEVWDDEGCNQMCDTCRHAKDFTSVDITQYGRQVVQIVELAASMEEKLTPLKLVEAWMGKGPAKRRKMIQTTTLPRLQAEAVIVRLLLQEYLREDFSFTPYTTYFYVKLGRKAPLLKSQTHTVSMKMRTTGSGSAVDTSAGDVEEGTDVTFDLIVMDNSCPPQPKQKLFKEQRNLSRKQDLKPVSQTDKQTEKTKKQLAEGHEEEDRRSILPQHAIEVDVEINIIDNSDGQKTPSHPVKPCSKRKSTTPQRARRKPRADAAAGVPSPSPGGDAATSTVPSSPSQASIISETAVEELCNLRNYYSRQLRRINYISQEYLGQPAEPGVLACIREPLRSLRLPRRATIAQTARSLWTRVSGRRKLVHR